MAQDLTQVQILEELTRRAEALWGSARAETLKASLRDTSRQLWEIRGDPPEKGEEPGFYQ
jgi:hypothetical protein